MKTSLPIIVAALLGGVLPGSAQEAVTFAPTARLLDELPDGTAVAEAPKPEFIVPAKDVLETKTVSQGGREVTVQKIRPIDLPEPEAVAVPDVQQPAIQQRVAAAREEHPDQELLFVSAAVYRGKDGATRTLATVYPLGKGESVSFWSTADFGYLSGFSSFIGSQGETRSLIMAWSVEKIAGIAELAETNRQDPDRPALPALPAGKAAFAIVSTNPAPEALAAVQSLHDLYNNERDRLKAAYEGREQTRLQQEAELRANPPRPKNITLSYWRSEKPAPAAAKGGAR
jgi:hypothetical protein